MDLATAPVGRAVLEIELMAGHQAVLWAELPFVAAGKPMKLRATGDGAQGDGRDLRAQTLTLGENGRKARFKELSGAGHAFPLNTDC
jgi:hypothetical protein